MLDGVSVLMSVIIVVALICRSYSVIYGLLTKKVHKVTQD